MTEDHLEIIELLGAYALDAVDPDERVLVEDHLRDCPRCAAEVAEHREVAALLEVGGEAPAGVWERIEQALEEPPPPIALRVADDRVVRLAPPTQSDDPLPAVTPIGDRRGTDRRVGDRRAPSTPRTMLLVAAAAVVALFVGAVTGLALGGDEAPDSIAAESLGDLARTAFAAEDARRVSLTSSGGAGGAEAVLLADGTGYLVGTSLPPLDTGETYQLWGVRNSIAVSLGVIGARPDVVAFAASPDVEVLVLTREIAGGVVSSTNPPAFVGDVS